MLSDDTSGPVTGMAISSVEKFLTYGMLGNRDGRVGEGSIRRSQNFTHAMFVVTMHKRQPIIQYARTDELMCVCVCAQVFCVHVVVSVS